MKRARASIEIAAPAGSVWPLIAEFRHWPLWGPSVRRVEADARVVAPGVRGRLQTPVGVWVPFEITTVEPIRSWNWRVAGLSATGHELRVLGPSRSTLEFTVSPLLAPYVVVLRRALARIKLLAEDG